MDDRRVVQAAYDELADAYGDIQRAGMVEPLERFFSGLDDDDRLLDAGCGWGDPVITARGSNSIGLDFSRGQLTRAQSNVSSPLVQGDMTALPFDADSFDAVSAIHSLIHVPLDDHRTVLEEFARVLQPGGELLVTEGASEWCGANPDWLDSGTEMRWSIAGADATRDDLEACGFELQGVWNVPDPTTEDGEKPFFLADTPGTP